MNLGNHKIYNTDFDVWDKLGVQQEYDSLKLRYDRSITTTLLDLESYMENETYLEVFTKVNNRLKWI